MHKIFPNVITVFYFIALMFDNQIFYENSPYQLQEEPFDLSILQKKIRSIYFPKIRL